MAISITVRPLTEADIPQHVSLIRYSFHNADDTCNRIMYPAGVTPAYLAFFTTKGLAEFRAAGSNKMYLGAFASDVNSGAEIMLATAKWVLKDNKANVVPENQPGVINSTDAPPDTNLEAFTEFHRKIEECCLRVMAPFGGPYWCLSLLATDMKYRRHGAGSALLAWGLERADAERRPVYLDAMERGLTFYERRGFMLMETVELDGKRWGIDRVGHWYSMVRQVGGITMNENHEAAS